MLTTLSNSGGSNSPMKTNSPSKSKKGSANKSRNSLNNSYMSTGKKSPNTSFNMTIQPERRTMK